MPPSARAAIGSCRHRPMQPSGGSANAVSSPAGKPILFPRAAIETDRSVGIVIGMDTRTQATHAAVFAAVTDLILRGGVPAVTLSAVCRAAKVSKGGLMHHFPTKEAMVHAFVSHSCNECLAQTHRMLADVRPGEGRRTLAFVDAMLRRPAMCNIEDGRELSAVMIALTQGSFTDIGLRYYDTLHRELRGDGIPRTVVNLVLTTIDGLWFQSTCVPVDTVEKLARQLRGQLRSIVIDVVSEKQQRLLGITS